MLRIPLLWRIMIPLLTVLIGVASGTIFMTRAISTGYECLENYGNVIDTQHTLRFSTWTYIYSYGQEYIRSRVIRSSHPVFLGSPASSWITNGKRTAHLDYYVSDGNQGL